MAELVQLRKITGEIKTITGLHIGGSSDIIEIGGNDNPIIRDPITDEPYIPGSSLKGKMRSLLEWKLKKVHPDGKVHEWCGDYDCQICRIFGTSANKAAIGPTRLIVRDAYPINCKRININNDEENDLSKWKIVETKWENWIDRIKAEAHPRNIERVVPDVTFSFEMVYRMFQLPGEEEEIDEKLFDTVLKGLKLVEMDGLGGSISRGCGKIEFGHTDDDGNWIPGEILIDGEIKDLADINLD